MPTALLTQQQAEHAHVQRQAVYKAGYLSKHLMIGACTLTELAEKAGVSYSEAIAALSLKGYIIFTTNVWYLKRWGFQCNLEGFTAYIPTVDGEKSRFFVQPCDPCYSAYSELMIWDCYEDLVIEAIAYKHRQVA